MSNVPEVIKGLETMDLDSRFKEKIIRIEHGRVNEIMLYEMYEKFPTSYSEMMMKGDYFLNRYVSNSKISHIKFNIAFYIN